MTFERTRPQTQQAAIYCQGRELSSAEVLGLPVTGSPHRRALPLLITGWIGLILIASDPLVSILTLFVAPALLALMHRQRA